jgi:outer membrane protein assembly factor BamD (BamD/ComL family)
MARLCSWLIVWLTLFCSASRLVAAAGEETRDHRAAMASLTGGFYDRAEREFAEFIVKYPQSEHVPEAVLRQAQAQFRQRKFDETIALLTANQPKAGALADQYLYWLAEARFSNGNYAAAANDFGKVAWGFTNSPVRLEASVGEAAALASLKQWVQVAEALTKPDGAFRQASAAKPESEHAARGWLLLAEAQFTLNRFAEAEAALASPTAPGLLPELAWRRQYLLCQVHYAAGRTNEALFGSTNLLTLAQATGRRELLPESIAFRADLLVGYGSLDEAKAVYGFNLTTNAPPERQRQALAKIAEIALMQNLLEETIQRIEQFLEQFTNSPAMDVALLALGELYLKQASPLVPQALTNFDRLIVGFTKSSFVPKAHLGRGWCFWISNNIPAAAEAFQIAADRLPPSEDQAVARFKFADALFAQKHFAAALTNYRAAQVIAAKWPRVKETLTVQSLYQVLRSSLELKEVTVASEAMRHLLQFYPNDPVADRSVLLVAQAFADLNEPDQARALFGEFVEKFPESELRADVELALAHTLEQQSDWPAVMDLYEKWLGRFATNRLRPQAEFYLALANFRAGNETNAFNLFTNFVVQFPTHDLAPKAQWWVADYYDRQGSELNLSAEAGYKLLFQTWPASPLAFEARMSAGRVALARPDHMAAIEHFTNLTLNPNCPPALKVRAKFGYAGALMLLNPVETNKTANLELAMQVLNTIQQENSGTETAAQAWGEIGKCYLQLAAQDARHYEAASNAFQQVLLSPNASYATRSQARVALGVVAESQGALKTGVEKTALLKFALGQYLDAFFYEKTLRDGEQPDWFWVKKAGQEAARIAETLGEWSQALNVYQSLQKLLPPLQASLEKKIMRAREQLALENRQSN